MSLILYTTDASPFGRALEILLDELGLDWTRQLAGRGDSAETRAQWSPTLQVPALKDGNRTLLDSTVIAEYLLTTYGPKSIQTGDQALATSIWRPRHEWEDRCLFAAIQTLGTSVVTVSQSRWAGTTIHDNSFLARNGERVTRMLTWLDTQLPDDQSGFFPSQLSVQDIFLICHLMFVTHRPLEIDWPRDQTPKLAALHDRLAERQSFLDHPISWWEPGQS